ncbi:MAG: HigA family addiction module antidote protein [Chloroflexi bacterium]|nr:HigA family addiction module antidote protein [Chloroflexota bacterium]
MDNQLIPARVVPPGDIIRRELEARGWTQEDLAVIMGRPTQAISEIVNARKQITAETARELAQAFGTSAQFWLNLETNYRLHLAERPQTEEEVALRGQIYNAAPVTELQKRGWIPRVSNVVALREAVCTYLGVASLDSPVTAAAALRHSSQRAPEQRSDIAWVRRVEALVRQQRLSVSGPPRWNEVVASLLALAEREPDVALVPQALLSQGVHFALVPHLPRTYLDGAALWVDERPVIALTLRYDRIDAFWFTLLHELAHLALGHQGGYLDQLYDGGRSRPAQDAEEEAANVQARDWLLDAGAVERFIEEAGAGFARSQVLRFAREQRRHPGIVVGRLHHTGALEYSHLRALLVKVSPYLGEWMDTAGPRA